MTFFTVLWFFLIFVLIGGYFVLDGFDLGAGEMCIRDSHESDFAVHRRPFRVS